MRKLTKNEIKRNKVYETIAQANFEDFIVKGHVKQGLLIENKDDGQNIVIKTIIKKAKVDFESEQIERPVEQAKEDKKEDKEKETVENDEPTEED